MNRITLILVAFVLFSCNSVKDEDLQKLNGYWEIKEVNLPNGDEKEYKVNETIDFFNLKGNQGFRQKLMPQFDGKYKTNDIKENIKITIQNQSFFIEYNTEYGKWKEEIISIEDSILVLKNKDNIEYVYKRYVPFSLK